MTLTLMILFPYADRIGTENPTKCNSVSYYDNVCILPLSVYCTVRGYDYQQSFTTMCISAILYPIQFLFHSWPRS